jgi:acyl CoA:acetate/3-ketoacid CoA transferase alpha subunit
MALIRAKYADKSGNLYFSKTARNFNGPMATAADIVVVEA